MKMAAISGRRVKPPGSKTPAAISLDTKTVEMSGMEMDVTTLGGQQVGLLVAVA